MRKLSMKEKIFYGLICSERRVYEHWYTRFLLAGVNLERIRRVVRRTRSWYHWCAEWRREGDNLERLGHEALENGHTTTARDLLHEAAGCYHVGQHFFYIDPGQKAAALKKIWEIYPRAIVFEDEPVRPIRIDVPFHQTVIPGYLKIQPIPERPLIICINGMDNLKEIEQHSISSMFYEAGFNTLTFDGPGQGEMWSSMKMIPDYETAVTALIDWLEANDRFGIDLTRIGALGFSMGGYLAPAAAAYDSRISCAAGNGGPARLSDMPPQSRTNPLFLSMFPHATGKKTYEESLRYLAFDITKAPPLERPLLIFHSGKDRLIPDGKKHGDTFMKWARGDKELRFYEDGEHVCANYLDEVLPYTVDWFKHRLRLDTTAFESLAPGFWKKENDHTADHLPGGGRNNH
jgi:alpha-beta hydrolase superfamily lysophospholipase